MLQTPLDELCRIAVKEYRQPLIEEYSLRRALEGCGFAAEGCWGNGGFLLVLKPDGVIKLATDDGMGFYEINTAPVELYDGSFHHILGRRKSRNRAV